MKAILLTALFILFICSYQADCNVTINNFSNIIGCANTNKLAAKICLIQENASIIKSTKNKTTPFDNWDAKMMIW